MEPNRPWRLLTCLCTLYSISTVNLYANFLPECISLLARRLFQAICYTYTISPLRVYTASYRLSLRVLSSSLALTLFHRPTDILSY